LKEGILAGERGEKQHYGIIYFIALYIFKVIGIER